MLILLVEYTLALEGNGSQWPVSGREETLPTTIMGSRPWGGFVFEQYLARKAVGDGTRALLGGSSTTAADGEVATVFNAKEIWGTVAVGDGTRTMFGAGKLFSFAIAAVLFHTEVSWVKVDAGDETGAVLDTGNLLSIPADIVRILASFNTMVTLFVCCGHNLMAQAPDNGSH